MAKKKPEKKTAVKVRAKQEVTYCQTIYLTDKELEEFKKDVARAESEDDWGFLDGGWINTHDVLDAGDIEDVEIEIDGKEYPPRR